MPKKFQHNVLKADLEEWYEEEEYTEEEEDGESQESSTSESEVEQVRKVLSDAFSVDTIREALKQTHHNPPLAIGKLLDEAAENFQSSISEETIQQQQHSAHETEDISTQQEKTSAKMSCSVPVEKKDYASSSSVAHSRQEEDCKAYRAISTSNPVVLVLGHVDVGKSTFLGHILHLTGNVDERSFRKLKKESADAGHSELSFAWIVDDQQAERQHGVTMDISIRQVRFNRMYTFMDTPGHEDFLSAVIAAASQAQVAILLVDASSCGQWEENGPTLQYAIVIRSMGVNYVIVAINKMDQVGYSEDKFTEISGQVMKLLTSQVGYSETQICCVPCSGLTGENIVQRKDSRLGGWYTGDTLMEAVDRFCSLQVDEEKKEEQHQNNNNENTREDVNQDSYFRMPCMDIVEEKKDSDTLRVSGCIMSGKVHVGDKVRIHPSQVEQSCVVRSIMIGEYQVSQAVAGDWSTLVLQFHGTCAYRVGQVLVDLQAPVTQGRYIVAQLVVFATGKRPILKGTPVMVYIHCFQGVGVVWDWISVRRRDQVSKRMIQVANPRFLKKGDRATVHIRTEMEVFCTPFTMNRKLSRICLRQERQLIASGVVSQVGAITDPHV